MDCEFGGLLGAPPKRGVELLVEIALETHPVLMGATEAGDQGGVLGEAREIGVEAAYPEEG